MNFDPAEPPLPVEASEWLGPHAYHLVTAQTSEHVLISDKGAGLLCSAVWGREPVSSRAPAADGVLRASASFIHIGPRVSACTSLSFLPEIHALALTIGCCFQKQYCGIMQHKTLYRNALGQHWPTQMIKCAWWSFSLSRRTRSSPALGDLGLMLAFGVSFSAWISEGEKLRESKAASVPTDLYPECMVFHQTVRYFCSAHVSDPNGQRRKAIGLPRPKHGANRQNARNYGK